MDELWNGMQPMIVPKNYFLGHPAVDHSFLTIPLKYKAVLCSRLLKTLFT
jgi:hypothetical protein